MKKKTLKTFYVYLSNHTDHRDDEVEKVKAYDIDDAARKAKFNRNRFSISNIVPARSNKKKK